MCNKCAGLKNVWVSLQKQAWEEVNTPNYRETELKIIPAWEAYHAQAMKHAHHKEDA